MNNLPPSIFRRLLKDDFEALPPVLRRVHGEPGKATLIGTAKAEIFLGLFGKLICWAAGLPAASTNMPATVTFAEHAGNAHWSRNFAGRCYASDLSVGTGRDAGLLVEKMGLLTLLFALNVEGRRLRLTVKRCRFLGFPLPSILSPRCVAYESEQDGAFVFDIVASLPFLGRLITYAGTIR